MTQDEVRKLAEQLMRMHGCSYKFKFDKAVRRGGYCNNRNKTISISAHLCELNSKEEITNVLLHEIAHALTPSHGHDCVWKRKAWSIGCDGRRLMKSNVVMPEKKITGECSNCGKVFKAHKRRRGAACSDCCKRYNNGRHSYEYIIKWN